MSTVARPVVLSDAIPVPKLNARVRDAVLITGFALLTALCAQITIHLSWTPVPVTLQTLAAIAAGGILGSRRGAMSLGLYLLLGLFFPFYSNGGSGWEFATGATGGYLIGMIVAAYLVGLLAERKEDRSFLTSVPAMLFGSAVVYAFGVPWLAHFADLNAQDAIAKGVAPFIAGDALKSLAAGAALPAAWMLVNKGDRR